MEIEIKYDVEVLYDGEVIVFTDLFESLYDAKELFENIKTNAGSSKYLREFTYRNGKYEKLEIISEG